MNATRTGFAVPLLRWILALVVIEQSCLFAFSPSVAVFFARTGLPLWVRPALGISEAVAALLFLLPVTAVGGGYLLLFIFAVAAVLHILHGQFDVGGLLVYAAAVLVCMTKQSIAEANAPND